MNKVSVVQAKARFSEMLAKVEAGQDVLITRRGAPVARLSAVEAAKSPCVWMRSMRSAPA